jgi:hypothetical protein
VQLLPSHKSKWQNHYPIQQQDKSVFEAVSFVQILQIKIIIDYGFQMNPELS